MIFEKRNSWLIKLMRLDDDVFPGGEEISAEEVAALAGNINYEVVTSIPASGDTGLSQRRAGGGGKAAGGGWVNLASQDA